MAPNGLRKASCTAIYHLLVLPYSDEEQDFVKKLFEGE